MSDQLQAALKHMHPIDDRYTAAAALVWDALCEGQREQLKQLLFQGPVWDGNVVSKVYCWDLVKLGLATRVCFLGKQGYVAATPQAFTVWKRGNGDAMTKKPGLPA